MPRLEPSQVRTGNTEVGDIPALVDVDGGGTPGLPVLDGRRLVNLPIGLPGQYQLGSPLNYLGSGSFSANEVQYTKVFLPEGKTLDRMRAYLGNSTGPSKSIRMGIYDQLDPLDANGVPNGRVAQTSLTPITENAVNVIPLISAYAVPAAGYYWLAVVRSSGGGQFNIGQTPDTAPAGFLAPVVGYESTTGGALPATAGVLTSPASAVVYVAAMEQ